MTAYLTYEERLEIEAGLKEHRTFGEIGKSLEKDRTTIAKEIKKNAIEKKTGVQGYPYNACIHRKNCKKKKETCTGLSKAPYVCNGCLEQDKCTLRKRIYQAGDAQSKAETSASNARSGILSNEEELLRLNNIISPLVENGHSVHQI